MHFNSNVDRLVLKALALCVLAGFLSGCMASAAVTVASQTVKTGAKAAGVAARITLDGARAVSHTVSRPFRKSDDGDNEPALVK